MDLGSTLFLQQFPNKEINSELRRDRFDFKKKYRHIEPLGVFMSYGTSIPFLMRKTKCSHESAVKKIKELLDLGLINSNSPENKEPPIPLTLKFNVISKYGRDLFYPTDEQAIFLVCQLLKQKTATKIQLKAMQDQGWEIILEYKEIIL